MNTKTYALITDIHSNSVALKKGLEIINSRDDIDKMATDDDGDDSRDDIDKMVTDDDGDDSRNDIDKMPDDDDDDDDV